MENSEKIIRDLITSKLKQKGLIDCEIEKIYENAEKMCGLYLTKKSDNFHERGAAFIDGFLLGSI